MRCKEEMADDFDDDLFIQASQQYEMSCEPALEQKENDFDDDELFIQASQQYLSAVCESRRH